MGNCGSRPTYVEQPPPRADLPPEPARKSTAHPQAAPSYGALHGAGAVALGVPALGRGAMAGPIPGVIPAAMPAAMPAARPRTPPPACDEFAPASPATRAAISRSPTPSIAQQAPEAAPHPALSPAHLHPPYLPLGESPGTFPETDQNDPARGILHTSGAPSKRCTDQQRRNDTNRLLQTSTRQIFDNNNLHTNGTSVRG